MPPTTNYSYEFSRFVLNPRERVLLYSSERVDLSGRDFDVLLYMVQNTKRLISVKDLIAAVWGDEPKIVSRNISHHIAKVRKALDCDPRQPTFIETIPKKGYRFIAEVKLFETADVRDPTIEQEKYLITAHLFVPIYVGAEAYDNIEGQRKNSRWANYKEFQSEEGRLCIYPNGFGVWHLTRTAKFATMSVIARWRRQAYIEILEGKHRLSVTVDRIVENSGPRKGNLFRSKLSTPGYVFSAFVLNSPRWANITRIRNALQLLACLTPLESKVKQGREGEQALERRILEEGFSEKEMCEFGLRGKDLGFASWNGMSYYKFSETEPGLIHDLIEFEIAAQAVWWFCKCLSDEIVETGRSSKPRLDKSIDELKDIFASVESINPLDSASQRTMVEAVLATSRLERLVDETIRKYERL